MSKKRLAHPRKSESKIEEDFDAAVNLWKHRKTSPQNKNYIRGRAFEYSGIRAFRKRGFICFRSFGSLGAVDYLAYRRGVCYLVQCKWSAMLTTDPRGHDLSKLVNLADDVGAIAVFQGVGKTRHMMFWYWKEYWIEFNPLSPQNKL